LNAGAANRALRGLAPGSQPLKQRAAEQLQRSEQPSASAPRAYSGVQRAAAPSRWACQSR